MIFLAAREAAHHRLYAHVPWLKERLLGAVEQYARGIQVDSSRIEELARGIDPSNPAASRRPCSRACSRRRPRRSRRRRWRGWRRCWRSSRAGWTRSSPRRSGDRLPGADALRETLRRRRASGGPAEQTFATVVGLELRPRRLRAASELWRLLTEQRGVEGRDALWAHPDLDPDRRRPRRPGRRSWLAPTAATRSPSWRSWRTRRRRRSRRRRTTATRRPRVTPYSATHE